MKSVKSVFSAIIKKVLCSLYEFHQQSSLDTIFLMSNIFSAHTEKTDFSETRNLSYLLRWCLCFRWSYVYFLWVRKRRISRIFWRHEFLKCKTCRNDWLLIEFIKITKSASVICWDEWFNSGVLDAHFYECGKRRFLWFSGDKKFSALDFWKQVKPSANM